MDLEKVGGGRITTKKLYWGFVKYRYNVICSTKLN
jgi:hypothetical protein